MTDEHPPELPLDRHETGILGFVMEDMEVKEVEYVAAAEGPDGHLAGYIDHLEEADKVDGPPDGINGYATIGFGYVSLDDAEPEEINEVWGDGAVLQMTGVEASSGILEVRYSQLEEKWWTVPAYIETDPEE